MTQRGLWQLAIVLATAIARLAWALSASPVVPPDSERYRNAADPLLTFQVWDGYGPGVLAQIVNLLPVTGAVAVQTVLAVALWGAAAIYAASVAPNRLSWPTFITIHAWSLSPWFFLWDTWILTETLTMSGCALAAVGIGATRTGAPKSEWVAVVGLAVAVATRPFAGALLLPLIVLAIVWPLNASRLRSAAAALGATLVLAVFAVWQVLAFASTSTLNFSYLTEPESLTQIQATDRYVGRGHLSGYLALARDEGMPACPEAEAIAIAPIADLEKLAPIRAIATCPDFERWLAGGGLPWVDEFIDTPSTTVAELVRPSYWLKRPIVDYMLPDDRIRQLRALAGARWDATVVAINGLMVISTVIVSLAALLLARGQRGFFAVSLSVVTAASVYAWGTDGIEYWRHLLPAFPILLPLAVTLLGRQPQSRPAG